MRPSRRRLVAVYLLGNYVFLLAGIPLPLPVEKDVSRPFPCQHHQCGCANADQCWRSCCCYSHEEKVAWAEEHGVTLPAELVAESRANSAKPAGCCHASTADGQLAHTDPQQREERNCCSHENEPAPATDSESQHDGVVGIRALECQGGSALWIMLATATPPAPHINFAPDLVSREFAPAIDPRPLGLLWAPEPPPPRA